MSGYRQSRITVHYPRAKDTFIYLGGDLVQRETRQGPKFSIDGVNSVGFLHQAGIKSNDRLVTVNYREVEGLDHDNLLESIRCLNPLMLGMEREVDDAIVSVIGVLDIAVGEDLNPFAKFVGVFYNTTTNVVGELIPLEVPTLVVYNYQGQEENIYLKATSGGRDYWLSTDGNSVFFTTDKHAATSSYTKYEYTFASQPQLGKEPVIYVSTSHSDRCLAANSSNILKTEHFDQGAYNKPNISGNDRFLYREGITSANFDLESSINAGYYVTKDSDNAALMTTDATPLTEEKN